MPRNKKMREFQEANFQAVLEVLMLLVSAMAGKDVASANREGPSGNADPENAHPPKPVPDHVLIRDRSVPPSLKQQKAAMKKPPSNESDQDRARSDRRPMAKSCPPPLGERLAAERRHRGLRLSDVTRMIGCGDGNVGSWERGTTLPTGIRARRVEEFLRGELLHPFERRNRQREPFWALPKLMRKKRKDIGFTQAELADWLECGVTAVENWEAGRHPTRTFELKLLEFLAA